MQTLCLSHAQVLSILRSNCLPNKGAKVRLILVLSNCLQVFVVAIETNWGPPVSGRFDVDYLHIWVALPDYLQIQLVGHIQ